jgi:hypothetical protein
MLADEHGDEPYAEMPCGRYVDDVGEFHRHKAACRDCREIVEADMQHSDGDHRAQEAAHEDAYFKTKCGGREGPDPLHESQDPRCRE